ncbi:hypothetical protein DMN91_010116 [Ooceraea biroi]|uniref:Uncharacterized protein n=1 Tax=Ooceraea biroi TaxID=2015173 RepID=A0A3L8DBK4_OOCBI|nr:hypothetical protein DMN91_010116 [Ooceraea biroi]
MWRPRRTTLLKPHRSCSGCVVRRNRCAAKESLLALDICLLSVDFGGASFSATAFVYCTCDALMRLASIVERLEAKIEIFSEERNGEFRSLETCLVHAFLNSKNQHCLVFFSI